MTRVDLAAGILAMAARRSCDVASVSVDSARLNGQLR